MSLAPKLGLCKEEDCPNKGKEVSIVSGRCSPCRSKRFRSYGQKKRIKNGKTVKKYTPTGEMGVFIVIWNTRPHTSELNGEPLGNVLKPIFFSHVLPKGTFPKYRLYDKNIVLLTGKQHTDWHSKAKSDLIKEDPRWQKIFNLYDELQQQYYEQNKIPKFD